MDKELLDSITGVIAAVTGLVIAVGGAMAAYKVLWEVRSGNTMTDAVHDQLNSAKRSADQLQESMRTALQDAGVRIPLDPSLHTDEGEDNAIRGTQGRRRGMGSNQYGDEGGQGGT